MKKLLILAILFLFFIAALPAAAVEWRNANQATIHWDAVATLDGGDPLPANNSIKYRIYVANAVTDPQKKNPVLIDTTDQTQYTLTFNTEGQFLVGVLSVRLNESGSEVSVAKEINWSDVNGASTPNPFGFEFYMPPAGAMNLR